MSILNPEPGEFNSKIEEKKKRLLSEEEKTPLYVVDPKDSDIQKIFDALDLQADQMGILSQEQMKNNLNGQAQQGVPGQALQTDKQALKQFANRVPQTPNTRPWIAKPPEREYCKWPNCKCIPQSSKCPRGLSSEQPS